MELGRSPCTRGAPGLCPIATPLDDVRTGGGVLLGAVSAVDVCGVVAEEAAGELVEQATGGVRVFGVRRGSGGVERIAVE